MKKATKLNFRKNRSFMSLKTCNYSHAFMNNLVSLITFTCIYLNS